MERFDYVIVGAGPAGCVLADRLSADAGRRVLLIESGPRDDHPLIHMPKGVAKLRRDARYMWSFDVFRRDGQNTDPEQKWMRGRTLGGSSAINGMITMKGHPRDYDDLAALTSDDWSWARMNEAFRAVEGHELGPSPTRGGDGPLKLTTYPGDGGDETLMKAAIASAESLGLERRTDINEPDEAAKVGYTIRTIFRGRRQSAGVAFLRPAEKRANLAVRTGLLVDRVVFEGRRAVAVECREGGRTLRFAGGRIILCAGTLGSPAILQRSGIGAPALLARHDIPLVAENREVGENLIEHTLLTLQWRARGNSNNARYRGLGALLSGMRYYLTRSGPLANATLEVTGLFRMDPASPLPEGQFHFGPHSFSDWLKPTRAPEKAPGFMIVPFPLRPRSKGSVHIQSRDAASLPRVVFDPLADPADRAELIAGVRFARRLAAARPLADHALEETQPGTAVQTDEEILEAVRTLGGPGFHAAGTCRMGADEASVVDPRTCVRGVDNLNVVDLSIFPILTSGNTYLPVAAAAWRAADLILAADRSGS